MNFNVTYRVKAIVLWLASSMQHVRLRVVAAFALILLAGLLPGWFRGCELRTVLFSMALLGGFAFALLLADPHIHRQHPEASATRWPPIERPVVITLLTMGAVVLYLFVRVAGTVIDRLPATGFALGIACAVLGACLLLFGTIVWALVAIVKSD